MPKIVDVARQRERIAHALAEVVATDGIGAVSVRTVAARARMSPGALRHYFPSQPDLLVFAMETIHDGVREEIVGRAWGTADPLQDAVDLLVLTLPVDEDSRSASRIWFGFAELALTDPRLAEVLSGSYDAMRGLCRRALGWLSPTEPEEDTVAALHAFIDGLAQHGVHEPARMSPDRVRGLLRGYLVAVTDRGSAQA